MDPKANPITPNAEKRNTCQPFRRARSGSTKKSVNSLFTGTTGKSCARLAQQHQMRPRFLAEGTVHQRTANPISQKGPREVRGFQIEIFSHARQVVTALSAVTTQAPQWRYRQRGRIPEEPKPAPLWHGDSDALFAPEVHSFLRRK
jgi:hypothetical protein